MKESIISLILACPLACSAAEYNFSGAFGPQFTSAGDNVKTFVQKAGRMTYHNTDFTGAGNSEVFLWNTIHPRADQSWILSADLTIPLLARRALTVGGVDPEIHAEIGIACQFGNSNFGAGLQQGFLSDSLKRVVISETQTDGNELFDPFPDVNGIGELLTNNESVRITIYYNAITHTLSTIVGDEVLFSVDIENADSASGASNQTDWGMAASDTFNIAIFGSSENYPVTANRPLQLDNLSFSLISEAGPPLSLTVSQAALELNITNNASKSPAEIQTSSNMTDWYTIQTKFGNGKLYVPTDNGSEFFRVIRTTP
jgi:hypothetical protein